MSSITVNARGDTLTRFQVSENTLCAAALTALLAVLVGLTWASWGDIGKDTGYDLVAASRVAHGGVPYRDFFYFYGPLAPFALGFAMLIGGTGLSPAIALGLLIATAIVVLTYFLARAIAGVRAGLLASALVAAVAFMPTNFSYVLPHTESATLGTLLLLGVLLALRREALVVAGVLGGLCALTRIEVEVALIAGFAAWLIARRTRAREASLLVVPAVLIPVAVYVPLASVVGLHRLVWQNLYPVDTLRTAGNAVIRVHAPFTLSSFERLAWEFALYAAGVALLLFIGKRLGMRLASGRAAAVGGGGLGLVVALVRPDSFAYWSGYAFLWIPAGAAIGLVFALLRTRDRDLSAEAAMLTALAAATYAAFQFQATRPQPAVYAAPLAVLLLVRVHLRAGTVDARALGAGWLAFLAAGAVVVTFHAARVESSTVRGPGGAVAATPSDASNFNAAVAWIDTHTQPGEPILIAPQLTLLYALTTRTDPLPTISLLPGALPHPSDELALIGLLERRQVRVAVIDRHVYSEYGHTVFGGSFDRTLAAWIHRNFRHVAAIGRAPGNHGIDIWTKGSS